MITSYKLKGTYIVLLIIAIALVISERLNYDTGSDDQVLKVGLSSGDSIRILVDNYQMEKHAWPFKLSSLGKSVPELARGLIVNRQLICYAKPNGGMESFLMVVKIDEPRVATFKSERDVWFEETRQDWLVELEAKGYVEILTL
jgi:hypothetical protein